VKTRDRNDLVEYFSAAARIPALNSVNVRYLLELHLVFEMPGKSMLPKLFQIVFSHGLLGLCTSMTTARETDSRDAQGHATKRLLPWSRKLPFAAHAMGNYG
jgi:hypothetical protein